MVTVKIVLDTRRQKDDGTSPLKLRIVLNRQTFHLYTGYRAELKYWDAARERLKPTCKTVENTTRFNALLLKEKQKAVEVLSRLEEDGKLESLSFEEIRRYLERKSTETMTLAFFEEIILELQEGKKFGNARVYDTILRNVRAFVKGKDFPLKQLTYAWLKRYEAWYFSKGNSVNGLSVSLRTLRALYNRAIKQKLISKEFYPFSDYKVKMESTRKRAISRADLERIKQFEPQTVRQARAKDYFLLSFYLMGASFIDLALLKVRNIIGDRIEYKRRKTGRLHSIPVSTPLQTILDKYLEGKTKDDFILNVIKSSDPQQQMVNVCDELKQFNRRLKEIAKLCGIEANLSSYVARHSYATIAKYKGVPTAVISEALGHSSEEVTQIYLSSFENEVLDKYHAMIIE